jgi:predicted nucleic acid-binding OB-fold protein
MRVLIEQVRFRRWRRRNAELRLAANLAVHEIKRRTIRELLEERRRVPTPAYDDVFEGTAEEWK